MKSPDLPPLPDDIHALLRAAEHGAPPLPPGAETAVLAKVAATTGAPLAGAALGAATHAGPLAAALSSVGVVKPVVALVIAVVVGGSIGVAVAHRTAPGAGDALVVVPAPAPPAPAQPPPLVVTLDEAINVAVDAPDRADNSGSSSHTRVLAESALLEQAREALARGNADVALARLGDHSRAYPRGALVEERRALTIVAWAQKGERERAQEAARAFEREYPASLFLETIRGAL